ncbi:MAG: TonB-dependent receptor [Sphingobacteriia bacterium]|nr:TonB-dependent receptor [Sphingobacteriia bacterium]
MNVKRWLAVLIPLLFLSVQVMAQDKVITGRVTDTKDGSPLSGASVLVKGTKIGTVTAADGSFSLKIPANTTKLVIMSLGYAQKEIDADAPSFQIGLIATNTSLNEVVVIGYGTAKKRDLTGSVVQLTEKDFNKGVTGTPEQLIAGKVAGVQVTSNSGAPGAGSTIRIRGGASLNASNDPLIVIDGVPLDNSGISGVANPLSLINPNDIESVNVLKDASATAIYGARGSNGVIIVTTKKGKSGKPKFNFTTQFSVANVYKKIDVLSADQMRAFVNAVGNTTQKSLLGNANTDWQKEIYQTALASDNNLSVSGSFKNVPYRLSAGFLTQDGVLKTDNLQRTSLNFNLTPKFFQNHLTVNLNVLGSINNSRFADQGAIGAAVMFDPTQPIYSGNNRFGGFWEWLDPTSISGLKGLSPKNPLGLLMERNNTGTAKRSVGSVQLDYKVHFLPDLHAKLNLMYDMSEGSGNVYVPDSAASNYKRFQDLNSVYHGGINTQYQQKKKNEFLQFYLNYAKELKSLQSRIDITGGYEYNDYLTTNYNYADYAADGTKRPNSDPTYPYDEPRNVILSWYARANYTFKNRYYLTATFRRDGSSRFSPAYRWANFPSLALAWNIKEESFLKANKTISSLKLRLSYGITGQQDGIGNYDYISYYGLSNTTAQYQLGNTFYQMYRPGGYYANRKWEQTATYNAAIDFAILDGKISGTLEAYNRKTTDLLNLITQPAGTNFSNQIVANIGSMENKGFEFTLNTTPLHQKDLIWDVGFNITYNENKITKLTVSDDPNYPGVLTGGISGGTGNTIQINSVGYSRNAFYVYQQVYDKAGKPIDNLFADRNRDGIISDKDLYRYKSPEPTYYLGINSNVTYKKWSAGFVMRGSIGNYMYNNVASSSGTARNILNPLNYLANGSSDVLFTNFSGNGSAYYLSDYYIQNASFLRMDNINVNYDFGKVLDNKASLRLGVYVLNAFVITKYKGADPEINGGIDNNFYPRPRVYALNLSLNF